MKPFNKFFSGSLYGIEVSEEAISDMMYQKFARLGNCCSYCEMPISGHQSEHIRSSSTWRKLSSLTDIENVLLICKDCRDHITTPELSDTGLQALLWPDELPAFDFDSLTYIYVPKKILYCVVDEDKVIKEKEMELVFIQPNPELPEELRSKAQNTIDHFQLNMKREYYNEEMTVLTVSLMDHQQAADNRVFHRTETWKVASETLERYNLIRESLELATQNQLVQSLEEQISTLAYFQGNWSIWMSVFYEGLKNSDKVSQLFGSLGSIKGFESQGS